MEILEVTISCCNEDIQSEKKKYTSLLLPTTDNYLISSSMKNYFADKISSDSKCSCKCVPFFLIIHPEMKNNNNLANVSKTFTITKLPHVLILCIKRKLFKNSKIIQKPIEIKTTLNLKDFNSDITSTLFTLKAINYINTKYVTHRYYTTDFLINGTIQ